MSDSDFIGGVRYFLTNAKMHKKGLLAACKRKYPKTGGRGVNIVEVPQKWIPENWRYGAIIDPGRYHINKERLDTIFKGDVVCMIVEISKAIDDYDPAKEVLFLIFTSSPKGCTDYVIKTI